MKLFVSFPTIPRPNVTFAKERLRDNVCQVVMGCRVSRMLDQTSRETLFFLLKGITDIRIGSGGVIRPDKE